MKNVIILIFAAIILLGCEDVVKIAPKSSSIQLVIEGFIVNEVGASYIRLSETTPYFSSNGNKPKSGALIFISDRSGKEVAFQETSKGYYTCPASFLAKIGETYSLKATVEGKTITASSTSTQPVAITKLRLQYAEEGDPELRKGYYLYGTFNDEKNNKNYFRAEIYVNGIRQQSRADNISVFDDRFFENQDNVEGQFKYWANDKDDTYKLKAGDEVSVRLYSIDYATYNFLKALSETPFQGGLFGKNPANVPSNVSGALGLFQATTYIHSETITVVTK